MPIYIHNHYTGGARERNAAGLTSFGEYRNVCQPGCSLTVVLHSLDFTAVLATRKVEG